MKVVATHSSLPRRVNYGESLVPGRWYRIVEIDPHDPDPTLKAGDVIRCAEQEPRCIDPENHEHDGMGTQWFADYDPAWDDGDGTYRTLITELEEVDDPTPMKVDDPTPMKVVYIAHPLRGKTPEETAANRRRASELTAIIAAKHKVAPVASWVILSEHWTEEEGRELGLKIDCALIERCDELWLIGPVRALSTGMQIERDHAEAHGVVIVDKRGVFE